uniref:Uncharacterized protein n=1 Tax=Romanomermis culicivorax TaxID=13658 RepID=A0A915J5G9_ROMCU
MFRASILHKVIERAEKKHHEQQEKPMRAKSKDKAGVSSEGGQSAELAAVLKAEFATQRAELAASIAELKTRLNNVGQKDASPKRKQKSAPEEKPPSASEGDMDE